MSREKFTNFVIIQSSVQSKIYASSSFYMRIKITFHVLTARTIWLNWRKLLSLAHVYYCHQDT